MTDSLPIAVQRALFEISLAIATPWPDEAPSPSNSALPRRILRAYHKKYSNVNNTTAIYPHEYTEKLRRQLRKNAPAIVQAALTSLVREGFPDYAWDIQEFLRRNAPHLL